MPDRPRTLPPRGRVLRGRALPVRARPVSVLPVRARPVSVLPVLLVPVLLLAVTACTPDAPSAAPSPSASPRPSALATPTTAVTLPPDALVRFVPTAADLPPGLLPVVSGSGPRDLPAVAAFSADPAAAERGLRAHGFRRAYVAQYAEPAERGRVLSVVVAEFATLPGAADDLAADVAASGTTEPADVPGASGARLSTQPLPGGDGTLTSLRFRVGTRTWLLASGAPQPDVATVLALGRALAARAQPT